MHFVRDLAKFLKTRPDLQAGRHLCFWRFVGASVCERERETERTDRERQRASEREREGEREKLKVHSET